MALVVGNAAEVIMLNYILNKDTIEDLVIHLYGNDQTPVETDLIGDYTEISGGGYAAVNLTAGSWVVTSGTPTSADYPQITWTFTGAVGNVYGYYVTRQTGGELMWAERFTNGPFNIQNNGDVIRVTPRLTLE